MPNPLVLPNGDQVCAAELDTDYGGFKLTTWLMDKPDEVVRKESFQSDPARSGLLQRLQTATPAQIDNWVDNTVVDLASARTVFKMIIKAIALDART